MYSLNVPVPGEVRRIASDLFPTLVGFESVRERHTLLCKRLDDDSYDRLAERARQALVGTPAFEARISGIGVFERPPLGEGPVVYLAVESPGLVSVHQDLCEAFDPVPDIEGAGYVPHVTLARGGSVQEARRLADREVESVEWTVSELVIWDADYDEVARRFSLPA